MCKWVIGQKLTKIAKVMEKNYSLPWKKVTVRVSREVVVFNVLIKILVTCEKGNC